MKELFDMVSRIPYITDSRWSNHAPITVEEYRRHVLATISGEEKW